MTEATLLNRLKRFGYGGHHGPMAKACMEAAIEIESLQVALAKQTEQHAYPCSPHCAGYLRAEVMREALQMVAHDGRSGSLPTNIQDAVLAAIDPQPKA